MEITDELGDVVLPGKKPYIQSALHLKKVFEAFIETLNIDVSRVFVLDQRDMYREDTITLLIRYEIKGARYGFRVIFEDVTNTKHMEHQIWYFMERFKEHYNEYLKNPKPPEWIHVLS